MHQRAFASSLIWFALLGTAWTAEPLLQPRDTVALIGGTFVERMQSTAALENELQLRHPDWQLRVRNLGWSGDDVRGFARKLFETDAQRGLERLLNDLKIAKPTVALVAYGFSEATSGAAGVERFEPGLRRLLEELKQMPCRVILMQPLAVPGVRVPDYRQRLAECSAILDRVAKETNTPTVEVYCSHWSDDGLVPSAEGYQEIGLQLADALVGGPPKGVRDESLEAFIEEKNELFFHRHRPQNETYLMLFRKHEQGNNAVELPQFDPLVETLDEKIWKRAGELQTP